MKINSLLAGTLALVLVAGFVSPVFAQLNSGETLSTPEGFVPTVATPASNGETLIDFETFPDNTPIPSLTRITTQFAPSGVSLFTTTDPGGPQVIGAGLPGQSGVNILAGFPHILAAISPIGIEFTGCVTDVSILGLDVGGNGLILEAFNGANVLVDSDSVTNAGLGIGDVDTLSVSGSEIVRVDIRQITSAIASDGYVIDDLRFTHCMKEVVGGELLPIDSTALLLAGAQSFSWMIPVVLSVLGIGMFVVSRKSENS